MQTSSSQITTQLCLPLLLILSVKSCSHPPPLCFPPAISHPCCGLPWSACRFLHLSTLNYISKSLLKPFCCVFQVTLQTFLPSVLEKPPQILVSSASFSTLLSMSSARLLMNTRKSVGPSTKPWGQSLVTEACCSDVLPLITTHCLLQATCEFCSLHICQSPVPRAVQMTVSALF